MIGKRIGIAGEHLSGAAMAAALSQALGREVVHDPLSPAAFRALGFPGADDLGNMFRYKAEFERESCGARDVAASRALHPGLQTFAQWLAAHGREIPL